METYANGAMRSESKPYYREIPLCVLRREGEALREGAEKYNEQPWDSNWRKGDTEYALKCLDHAFEHLQKFAENVKARLGGLDEPWPEEDHLGHLRANTGFLAWFEQEGRFEEPEVSEGQLRAEESQRDPEVVNRAIDAINAALDEKKPVVAPETDHTIVERIRSLFGGQLP